MNDGGQLFYMGITVWVCCAILIIVYKNQVFDFINKFRKA